ncbi:unnamed protein product [Rotaria sordida]|uniref:Tubulin-tyrosine ligase family protein n=1 Tax=Rotaria sordida TaxID=392033 RepID=A0A815MIB8_9BILA|nr:unnamed protein product [Rotaria sordida]
MRDIMCKSNLTRSLNAMRRLFPDEYDFYPKTWFLPEQTEQFQNDARSIHKKDQSRRRPLTTFIVKPSDGSEGEGIFLIQDSTRCTMVNRPYIIQEYVDRPLLINGLKFDMRIYVLILKLDPLEVLLYDEGLARFATVEYQAPSKKNLHESFMHLTNYSLNKRSANYKHASDEKQTDASKRKLNVVWSQLGQLFSPSEIEQTKEMIEDMINKTVLAILPELRIQYTLELPMTRKQNQCFQIIGFDIILTDQLKPMLLEVNANPSLCIDFDHVNEAGKYVHELSPIDEEIKKPLVLETLKLVIRRRNQSRSNARGYKAMSNRPFRNFASICGIIDESITMPSIDLLYIQIFNKCKEYASQSPATGLNFSAFVEAFFLVAQRKYPTSSSLLEIVTELVESCIHHLDLVVDESL